MNTLKKLLINQKNLFKENVTYFLLNIHTLKKEEANLLMNKKSFFKKETYFHQVSHLLIQMMVYHSTFHTEMQNHYHSDVVVHAILYFVHRVPERKIL